MNSLQDKNGMVAPELIYFTNSENTTFNRSHGGKLLENYTTRWDILIIPIGSLIIKVDSL